MTPDPQLYLTFFKDLCLLELIKSAIIDKNEDIYPSRWEQDKGASGFKLKVAAYVRTSHVAIKAYV